MEQYVVRLTDLTGWTYLGGNDEAKKPIELVVRAFEHDVLGAVGDGPSAPSSEPVVVPLGQGRRLEGKHFFVKPAPPARACLISHRGLLE